MAKAKSAIPEGFRSLTPYLIITGAATFLDFIQNAFGASEKYLMRDPNGIVRHAEARIGDAVIEFAEAGPGWSAMPAGLHLYVKNADDVYARALKAGEPRSTSRRTATMATGRPAYAIPPEISGSLQHTPQEKVTALKS